MIDVKLLEKKHLCEIVEISSNELGEDAWTKEMFESGANTSVCWVACENEKALGFVNVLMGNYHYEILDIAVSLEQRRRGIASALLAKVIEMAKENHVNEIFLEVRASNQPALSLYEKAGFKKIGERKKYYKGIEDAILLKFAF